MAAHGSFSSDSGQIDDRLTISYMRLNSGLDKTRKSLLLHWVHNLRMIKIRRLIRKRLAM
jgi:hypothetical protein